MALFSVLATVAVSAIAASQAPKAPGAGNYAQASAAGTQADLDTLPFRRQIEAASRLGTKVDAQTGRTVPIYETKQMATVTVGRNQTKQVPYDPKDFQKGGQYFGMPVQVSSQQVQTGVKPETKTYDFTGQGDVQNQANLSRELAQVQLDLQKKYGTEFAQEAVNQEALADPEGTAARKLLYQAIADQAATTPNRPVADLLQKQFRADATAGNGLTGDETDALKRTLTQRAAMGDSGDQAALEHDLTLGLLGDQQRAARQQNDLSWLTSGATPEDVAYRRDQQNITNLGAFLSGATPEAQFSQLSGAQQGASPTTFGPSLSRVNQNAGQAATSNYLSNYRTTSNNQLNSPNAWLAGISTALKGAGAAASAGWQPFAN